MRSWLLESAFAALLPPIPFDFEAAKCWLAPTEYMVAGRLAAPECGAAYSALLQNAVASILNSSK